MFKTAYDLAISFGPACSCSETLRRAGMQYLSFPFDWVTPVLGTEAWDEDMRRRADLVAGDFEGWLRPEDFEFVEPNDNGRDKYRNVKSDIMFVHDFPLGAPFAESFPPVKAKYERRIARMMSVMRSAKRVLVFRLDRPDLDYRTPLDHCRHAREKLSEKFPGVRFDIILMQPDEKIPFEKRKVEAVEPGISRIVFDYMNHRPGAERYAPRLDLTAPALEAIARVRDYRTKAERNAFNDKRRRARWAKLGADSIWQYQWRRFLSFVGLWKG